MILSLTFISCFLFFLQIRMGQQVPTLEDLSKQAVNQHRAIIAVNGKLPDQYVKAKGHAFATSDPNFFKLLSHPTVLYSLLKDLTPSF